jgi:hypothetical protein
VSFATNLVSNFGSMVCDFLFSGVQVCVCLQSGVRDFLFFVAMSCVNFCFFQTIQYSKCHVFAAVVYCFLTDSLKIFRNIFSGCFFTDGLFC